MDSNLTSALRLVIFRRNKYLSDLVTCLDVVGHGNRTLTCRLSNNHDTYWFNLIRKGLDDHDAC